MASLPPGCDAIAAAKRRACSGAGAPPPCPTQCASDAGGPAERSHRPGGTRRRGMSCASRQHVPWLVPVDVQWSMNLPFNCVSVFRSPVGHTYKVQVDCCSPLAPCAAPQQCDRVAGAGWWTMCGPPDSNA
jgi:hypothetical protein